MTYDHLVLNGSIRAWFLNEKREFHISYRLILILCKYCILIIIQDFFPAVSSFRLLRVCTYSVDETRFFADNDELASFNNAEAIVNGYC